MNPGDRNYLVNDSLSNLEEPRETDMTVRQSLSRCRFILLSFREEMKSNC